MNTVNKKLDSPHKVIVINSDEESEKNKHRNIKKCKPRRNKLHHTKKGKLRICQKVELNKDQFSYVISVNAEMSDIKKSERKITEIKQCKYTHRNKQHKLGNNKYHKTHKGFVEKCKDKAVPNCLRHQCVALIRCKIRNCEEKEAKERLISKQKSLRKKYKHESKKSICNHHRKASSCNFPCIPDMLSPISALSFKNDSTDSEDVTLKSVISYDDISLDSPFNSDKLDKLIQRTKQRERKMQEKTTKSRQVMVHRRPHLESEDETLTLSSRTSGQSIRSMTTLIVEREHDDNINSLPKNHLDFSDNVSNKTKYKPYYKKSSVNRHERVNNTLLHCKDNDYKQYSIESKKKIETYIPSSTKELNETKYVLQNNKLQSNYQNYFMKPEYPTSSAYISNYPQSVFNYPWNFNVNSESTFYRYPYSYNHETHSYYYAKTHFVRNKVDCLINSSNSNLYTNLSNYPVEPYKAPLSGGVHYDNSTNLSQFPEHSATHSFFRYNSVKLNSHIIGSNQNNCSYYDPVKFESWSTGYNPNYPIN